MSEMLDFDEEWWEAVKKPGKVSDSFIKNNQVNMPKMELPSINWHKYSPILTTKTQSVFLMNTHIGGKEE